MRAAKNVLSRLNWVAVSLILVISQITPVVISTARAKAAAYELSTSSGTWTDTDGGSGITGLNTNEVRWGTPANDQNKKSGLKFVGSTNQTFNEGDKFLLGELTHYNWPVAGGTAANGATLKIVLDFNAPAITPDPDFTYDFVIDETTNRYPCDAWQISNTPCDDMITFPNSYGSKSFTIGDKLYTLKIEGFTNCGNNGNPVSQFITEESKDSKACLYGSLSSILVNRPQLTLVEKAVNGNDADVAPGPTLYVGDTASFTYKVQNTGNVTMTNVVVIDNKGVVVTCPKTTLAAGELMTCSGSSAVVAGQYTNIAHATGKYNNQTYTSNDEPANYNGIPKPGNLTVTKVVVNDDGGTAVVSDFPLFVSGTSVTSGQSKSFAPGSYTITETQKVGYEQTTVSGSCSKHQGSITVTVVTNGNATCVITNNDKAPKLTLKKAVTKDNGGTAQPGDWTVKATPGANNVNATTISGNGNNGVIDVPAKAGVAYTLSESNGPSGYSLVGWSCTGGTLNGTVLTLSLDQSVTCTVTNNDIAPGLTLVKNLVKNNGGTANATDWTLNAVGTLVSPTNLSGVTGSQGATSGVGFKADTYTLSETGGPSGYTKSNWTCTNNVTVTNSKITLVNGQTTVCTITNDDDAAGLTLIKNLVDQYNSGAAKTDWTLTATGPMTVSGAGGATSSNVSTGSYTLGESGPSAGFDASTWDCGNANIVGTTLQIALGQQVTCTITNTAQPAKLIVKKVVTNNSGGTLEAKDFSFKVNSGSSVYFEADGQNDFTNLPKGIYTVVEDQANLNGYETTYDGCSNVSISNGETKTCTITNNDKAPKLTIDKVLVKDNGGSAKESDWLLKADGPTTISGQGGATSDADFKVGTYTLTESGGPNGYTASEWECEGGELNGNQVTIGLGDNVSCQITNNDDAASLSLVKKLVDTFNLGAETTDWVLTATGPSVVSGQGGATSPSVTPGVYTLSELSDLWGFNEYSASDWSCTGGSLVENSLTIALGDNVNCEITNTTKGATIIVKKVVINDDNGTLTAGDFSANVGGDSKFFGEDPDAPGDPLMGEAVFYVPGGHSYTVTEDQEEDDNDYIAEYENNCDEFDAPELGLYKTSENWDEEDCFGDCSEMYVRVDETIVCTITNDDLGGGVGPNVDLSIDKDDNGVVAQAGGTYDYTLTVQNNGFFPATNVVLDDVIPATLKVNSIDDGAWTCAVTGADVNGYGGNLHCTLPLLFGGSTADVITLNVTVSGNATGTIVNTATVASQQIDYNTENNSDTETTPLQAIKVVKSGPASANAGDTVTYTFTVTNTGVTPLSSITVSDTIAGAGVYQSGDVNLNGLLEASETWIYTANYKIPTGATDHVNNTVTACGTTMSQTQLPSIQLLRINSIAVPAPTTSAPVCDDDSHSLTINGVLVDTGNPIMASSVMAIVMLIIATYMALPRKRSLTSSK